MIVDTYVLEYAEFSVLFDMPTDILKPAEIQKFFKRGVKTGATPARVVPSVRCFSFPLKGD
jgi:hypothetical protein